MEAVELLLKKADGNTFWAHLDAIVTAQTFPDTARERREYRLTVSDITDRKHAEEERDRLLAEVQRRAAELTATFASIVDGLMVYDQEGKLQYLNATAERVFGYTPEERTLST